MTEGLLENIESVPSLPESVQEVERVYRDIDSSFEDMQKAIEKDPFLTANILRLVNSPFYGLKTKVKDLSRAVGLLGKGAIRTFVLSSAIDSNFEIDLSPYDITPEQFRLASEKQMALMINWSTRTHPKDVALLAPAAFLVDIGRLLISKTLIEDAKVNIIQEALHSGADIAEAEITACGAQTTDVTASLFHKWGLEPKMIYIIRYANNPANANEDDKELTAYLKAIRETVLENGEITEDSIAAAKATIEEFGLNLEQYESALEKLINT